MSKEDDVNKAEDYLDKALVWIYKAQGIAEKYNIETDYLANMGCCIDEAKAELKES